MELGEPCQDGSPSSYAIPKEFPFVPQERAGFRRKELNYLRPTTKVLLKSVQRTERESSTLSFAITNRDSFFRAYAVLTFNGTLGFGLR